MPVIRATSQSRFRAYLEGGPELAAKLQALDKKVRLQYSKDAVMAGAKLIAAEWSSRAPVGQPPEETPGAYRESLLAPDAIKVGGTKNGARGTIRPGTYAALPENLQPRLYAAKLEFVDGEPSARPAFDAAQDAAVAAIADVLKKAVA